MKTLKVLLVLVAVILFGFSKDSQRTEAGVVKPIKMCGQTIDVGGETMCTPSKYGIGHTQFGLLKGNVTHGGKIIPASSPWEITNCSTDLTSRLNISTIYGTVTVANGDSFFYDCIMIVNIDDKSVIMNITVTDGVGKFEGVTGQMVCKGSLNGVVTFCGEGFMNFPK
jgi:hypothetical protein